MKFNKDSKVLQYKVQTWEFERGWGSRPDFAEYFDEKEDAMKWKNEFNSKNTEDVAPDWYMIAYDPVVVDVEVSKLAKLNPNSKYLELI